MFMVSFRLRRKRVLIGLGAVLLATAVFLSGQAVFGEQAVATGGNAQVEVERPSRVRNNDQRLEYIASFGWSVEPEPVEIIEVIIPREFDELYEAYNQIQQQDGFDLTRYQGRRAMRYTYVVTNYPDQPEDVRLNLLVRDNRVIGGDVYMPGPNGFMHGLSLPETS